MKSFARRHAVQVAVIGAGECDEEVRKIAHQVGLGIAKLGHTLICGGLGGVMEAACCGAKEAGGVTVGIVPGNRNDANSCVDIEIASGMGHARNAIIVRSADAVIALPGSYGTLSEIALALKMERKVINLGDWDVPGALNVDTPEEALDMLSEMG
jgi:uncharacterized protein (TIGR00725 family)